ncbi:MAG: helix-turn-helix protein [candidate division BRC1 bacterium ADurb.BinA364]|nr:MAG: helix-turn-helix protein [candidate division BRC1 bacterium ADurb.BinA364]
MGAIAERIKRYRKKMKLTQDQLGAMYSVSGPAMFKFERGYVVPSLELWLRLARDMNINPQAAVLMHVYEKLPKQYKDYADWESLLAGEGAAGLEQDDFAAIQDSEELRQAVESHQWLPSGLCGLARSRSLWALYRPTGEEIGILRDIFTPLGEGSPRDFCDALRLIREFRDDTR